MFRPLAWLFHYTPKMVRPGLALLLPLVFLGSRWRTWEGFWQGVLLRPGAEVSDYLITFWPNMVYLRSVWQAEGHLPQWRTLIFSGTPLVGDPQSGLGYLPNILHLLLPPESAFHLLLWAHLTWGTWGALVLARKVGLSRAGQALVGMGWALFPRIYAHWGFGHVGLVYAASYVPWGLAAAMSLAREQWRWMGILALTLGAQWVNHPQMALYTALMGTGLMGVTLGSKGFGSTGERVLKKGVLAWAAWLGGGLWSLLVAAVVLAPLIRHLPWLARQGMAPEEALINSLTWYQGLLGWVLPDYGGHAEGLIYVGFPMLALVGLGLARPAARAWGWLVLLALLYTLGEHFPPAAWVITHVPGLRSGRIPPRIWFTSYPLVLLIAGTGLEDALAQKIPRGIWRAFRLAFTAVLVALAMFVGAYRLFFGTWPPGYWFAALGWALPAWALGGGWVFRLKSSFWKTALILGTVLVDLWIMDRSLVQVQPLQRFFDRPQLTSFLTRQTSFTQPWRTYSPSYSLPQHIAVRYGLETADGVDPLYPTTYDLLMQYASGIPRKRYTVTVPYYMERPGPYSLANRAARPDPCLLGLLNVRYVLTAFPMSIEGLRLVGIMDGVWVYENTCWGPRAFLVGRVLPMTTAEAALRWVQTGDWRRAAAVEGGPTLDNHPVHGRVTWLERSSDRLRLKVTTNRDAWLVLVQNWHPDWHATVDGVPTPYRRTNGTLGGLLVPAGTHEITLTFRSAAYRWGQWVTLIASLAALGFGCYPRHGRPSRLRKTI